MIWALELLLVLRRAAPGCLRRDELVQHLRATPTLIDRLLSQFHTSGLIARNDSRAYRFDCATQDISTLREALAVAAEERPIALRDAIISAPNDKLRDLADAFRFKNPDKGFRGDLTNDRACAGLTVLLHHLRGLRGLARPILVQDADAADPVDCDQLRLSRCEQFLPVRRHHADAARYRS